MTLSENEVRYIVRDELRKAFGFNNTDILWVDAKEAARQLGYGSNVRSLYYLKDTGVLRVGKEVQDRRPPGSTKGDYYFNIQACLKRLNTPPEKRAN